MTKPTIEEQAQLIARWESLSYAVENGFYETREQEQAVYKEMNKIEKRLQSVFF